MKCECACGCNNTATSYSAFCRDCLVGACQDAAEAGIPLHPVTIRYNRASQLWEAIQNGVVIDVDINHDVCALCQLHRKCDYADQHCSVLS